MSHPRAVVIAVGNEYRRDDGVGPAVLAELRQSELPADVALTLSDGEPTQLFEAWAGMPLAVVVDAVLCEPRRPGRLHRTTVDKSFRASLASTHGLGIPEAVQLADALDRAPQRLVVLAVEAADLRLRVRLVREGAPAGPGLARTGVPAVAI